jgi:predicted Fe-Mo cluster-binding NifX family protein
MKTAFAYWEDRIAPVLDTARCIHVVEADHGRIVGEWQGEFADDVPFHKALQLARMGVGVLVCGAISRPLRVLLGAYGIDVIPFVAGELRAVIEGWLAGRLKGGAFAMPGCWGAARRRRGVNVGDEEAYAMNRGRRGGMGQGQGAGQGANQGKGRGAPGQGRGQGRGRAGQGQGPGRAGGPAGGGAPGACQCPQCGHREPHERGVPCIQKPCPECGTVMIRA